MEVEHCIVAAVAGAGLTIAPPWPLQAARLCLERIGAVSGGEVQTCLTFSLDRRPAGGEKKRGSSCGCGAHELMRKRASVEKSCADLVACVVRTHAGSLS